MELLWKKGLKGLNILTVKYTLEIDQEFASFCFKTGWFEVAHESWVSIKNVSHNFKKIGSLRSKKCMCYILGFKLVLQVWV